MKRILKGLDTHGNNLKGQRRTEETGELLLVAYAPGGAKGQMKVNKYTISVLAKT